MGKLTHFGLVHCYKGKEKLVEEDEDGPPTHYIRVCWGCPFQHEIDEIMTKLNKISEDWKTLFRVKKFRAPYSGLEPKDKFPIDGYHLKNGKTNFCFGHQGFIYPSNHNTLVNRTTWFYYQLDKGYSFVVYLPHLIFFFIRPKDAIVEDPNEILQEYQPPYTIKTIMKIWRMSCGQLRLLYKLLFYIKNILKKILRRKIWLQTTSTRS